MRGVSLTGSERAGSAVAEIAGRNLKKVVLELGGSDPFIVLGTDDMDATVESAVGARLENSGQACNAAKRFIVVDDLYDEFVDKFSRGAVAVEPSDPTQEGVQVGPLSSSTATERLADQVKRAVDQGATLVAGGEPRRQLLRDDDPHRHQAGQRRLQGGVLRAGGLDLPRGQRGRGGQAGQRHPVRPGLLRDDQRLEQAVRVANKIDAGTPANTTPGAVDITVTTLAGTSPVVSTDKFGYTACVVPKLKKKKLKQAKRALWNAGCLPGTIKGRKTNAAKVVKQNPKPGKTLVPGAKVNVKLAG